MLRDTKTLLAQSDKAETLEERSRLRLQCSEAIMQEFLEAVPAQEEVKKAWLNDDLGYKVGDELFLQLDPADENFLVQKDDTTSLFHENSYLENGYWRLNRIWFKTQNLDTAAKVTKTLYSEYGMKVRVLAIRPELCNLITEFEVLYP